MLGNRCNRGELLFLILLLSLALGLGCRRELPELFDRNVPPETFLTAAPVESLFDGFRVRLHWYGNDSDGEISHYLWAWTDSSRAAQTAWNPETSTDDRIFREGLYNATHLTTKTDSVFLVEANDNGGTTRDLTFNIVAVDDRGRRDPVPARKYFFASVDNRPEIVWTEQPPGTLMVGESFNCAFTGATENEPLLGFQFIWGDELSFQPLNADTVPTWTYMLEPDDDQGTYTPYSDYFGQDTIRLAFSNDISNTDEGWLDFYKNGFFTIMAKCVDISGAESESSGDPDNLKGTIIPILNFDPDTRLRPLDGDDHPISVTYHPYGTTEEVTIYPEVVKIDQFDGEALDPGYHYQIMEPLPWGEDTWMRLNFQGWDMDDPMVLGADSLSFLLDYEWQAINLSNPTPPAPVTSLPLYPSGGRLGYPEMIDVVYPENEQIYNPAGSDFQMNLAPFDYTVRGRTMDPFGRTDGTPCTVHFSCGYPSVVDSIILTTEYPGPGILPGINITNFAEQDTIEIDLRASYTVGSTNYVAVDPLDPNTIILDPFNIIYQTEPPYTIETKYYIIFNVYGHDDLRNGTSAQLGRIQWDLTDPGYPASAHQFSEFMPGRFWDTAIDGDVDGACIQNCWIPITEASSPPPENFYQIRLEVTDDLNTIFTGIEPEHLQNHKTISARFTQTTAGQSFEEKIESTSKGSFVFNTKGRPSERVGRVLKINYHTID